MKAKLYFTLFTIFIALQLNGQQQWAKPGATWYNFTRPFASANFFFVKLTYEEDVMINGRMTQRIQRENANGLHCSGLMWNHQLHLTYENEQLYYYHDYLDTFIMMIDFAAVPGDSWSMYALSMNSMLIQVDSLSTVSYPNLGQRNVQHVTVNLIFNSPYSDDYSYTTEIVEGLGFMTGLYPDFYEFYSICDGSREFSLSCYVDDETDFTSFDGYNCDSLYLIDTSTESIAKDDQSSIQISPNPVKDQLQIEADNWLSEELILDLYSVGGQRLKTVPLSQNRSIDLKGLASGLYFVMIYPEDRLDERQVFKIVKE